MVSRFIRGTPYSRIKTKGRLSGPNEWSAAVKEQTCRLRPIKRPCRLEVSFILPADRFPLDNTYGNDLDNLLKRLLDALGETVLRDAPGKDGAIVQLSAEKRKALADEPTGVWIRFTKPDPGRRLFDRAAGRGSQVLLRRPPMPIGGARQRIGPSTTDTTPLPRSIPRRTSYNNTLNPSPKV